MKARRPGSVRLASLGGAILLTASVMAMLQVGATAASAAPVTENFASYAAAFTLFVPSSLTTNITQPALVAPDASYSMSVGSRTEAVPTSLSGLTIGYTTGIETVIPVPSGDLRIGEPFDRPDVDVREQWGHNPRCVQRDLLLGGRSRLHGHAPFLNVSRLHINPLLRGDHRRDPFCRGWHADLPGVERLLQGNRRCR